MNNCQEYKILLTGLLDDELTEEEKSDVNQHLIRCESCRQEYEDLVDSDTILKKISFQEPGDVIMEKIWKSPYSTFLKNSGLFFIIAGWFVLILFALYQIIFIEDEPIIPRIATAAMIIGFFMLLFSVIRERFKTYKNDPYKEVLR